jgi:hypothetical protein
MIIPSIPASEHCSLVYHRSGKIYVCAFATTFVSEEEVPPEEPLKMDYYIELPTLPAVLRIGEMRWGKLCRRY